MSLFERLWRLLTNPNAGVPEPTHAPQGFGGVALETMSGAEADEAGRVADQAEQYWWAGDPARGNQAGTAAGATAVDEQLFDALTKTLDDSEIELPRMPRVADQALLKLREENVDYRDLANIVQQDAALTAQVLRVANSVMYRGFSEIRNLDLAFARIGQRALRSVILGTTVRNIAIRTGGSTRSLGEELWRGSLASGVVCGEVAKRLHKSEDDAFLIGLLHDIGMLGVLRVCHDYAQRRGGKQITPALYYRLATDWHQHLGRRLADAWALPDPLPELIGSHHAAVSPDDPQALNRNIIAFADAVCALLEYAPYQSHDLLGLPCAKALGIPRSPSTREWLQSLPETISTRVNSF